MKIILSRDAVANVIKHAAAAVMRNPQMPMLSCLLIKGEGTRLTVTGSDLQSQVTINLGVQELSEPVALAVNARKLTDIVSSMPIESEITMTLADNASSDIHYKDLGCRLLIQSGRSSFKLQALSAGDFPLMKKVEDATTVTLELAQGKLRSMLASIEHAVGVNDTRAFLNGVFFDIHDGKLHCVATNGHRLATTCMDIAYDKEMLMILPRKTVSELIKSLSESEDEMMEMSVTQKVVSFKIGTIEIISKLIDGKFPDWRRVIPAVGQSIVCLPVKEARASLSRASIVLNNRTGGAVIAFQNNTMRIDASKGVSAENEDMELEMDVTMTGEGFSGGWNVDYLMDALAASGADEISVSQVRADGPMLISAPQAHQFRAVVMAMRL